MMSVNKQQPKQDVSQKQEMIPITTPGAMNELSVKSLYADLKNGMPVAKIDDLYPEYVKMKPIINALNIDIQNGMPDTEIPNLYPELM